MCVIVVVYMHYRRVRIGNKKTLIHGKLHTNYANQ